MEFAFWHVWQYGPFCFITNNFISSLYFILHIWVCSVQTSIVPSKEECYIKGRAVQIDKLKKKHFQSEAVLPLRFGARLLCEENYQSFRGLFRLSISLGTKTAYTCKSICKVACCFRNITGRRNCIQNQHSANELVDLEIYSGVWICSHQTVRKWLR